jgi:hypothetical protein
MFTTVTASPSRNKEEEDKFFQKRRRREEGGAESQKHSSGAKYSLPRGWCVSPHMRAAELMIKSYAPWPWRQASAGGFGFRVQLCASTMATRIGSSDSSKW